MFTLLLILMVSVQPQSILDDPFKFLVDLVIQRAANTLPILRQQIVGRIGEVERACTGPPCLPGAKPHSKRFYSAFLLEKRQQNYSPLYYRAQKICPIVYIPCPCGYFSDAQKACTCAPASLPNTKKRISDPLLDRIDIHIKVPRVDYEKLSGDRVGETSDSIRQRLQAARDIQQKRFSNNGFSEIVCNANMQVGEIRQFCKIQDESQSLMRSAMTQLNLSARAYACAYEGEPDSERGGPFRAPARGATLAAD